MVDSTITTDQSVGFGFWELLEAIRMEGLIKSANRITTLVKVGIVLCRIELSSCEIANRIDETTGESWLQQPEYRTRSAATARQDLTETLSSVQSLRSWFCIHDIFDARIQNLQLGLKLHKGVSTSPVLKNLSRE